MPRGPQRRPIDVYTLVSEPGIESRIADIVGSKKALFTGVFDGTTDQVTFERSGSFLSRIERIVTPALTSAQARVAQVPASEDDGIERQIDDIVAAGDESRDVTDAVVTPSASIPAVQLQRLLSGLSIRRTGSGGLVVEAPRETASTLVALFSDLARLFESAAAPPGAGRDPARRC